MKNIKLISLFFVVIALFLLITSIFIFAEIKNEDLILSIKTNQKNGVKVIDVEDMLTSAPQSFFVTGDEKIYILDSADSCIKIYKNNQFIESIEIEHPYLFMDIYVSDDTILLLDENYTILKVDFSGKIHEKLNIPKIEENSRKSYINGKGLVAFFEPISVEDIDNNIIIKFSNNEKYVLENGKLINVTQNVMEPFIENSEPYIYNKENKAKIIIPSDGLLLKNAILKADNTGDAVVEYNSISEDEKGNEIFNRKLLFINNNIIESEIDLLFSGFFIPNKDIIITEDNKVYQMVITNGTLNVYKSGPQKIDDLNFRPSANIIRSYNSNDTQHKKDKEQMSIMLYNPISRDDVFMPAVSNIV